MAEEPLACAEYERAHKALCAWLVINLMHAVESIEPFIPGPNTKRMADSIIKALGDAGFDLVPRIDGDEDVTCEYDHTPHPFEMCRSDHQSEQQ